MKKSILRLLAIVCIMIIVISSIGCGKKEEKKEVKETMEPYKIYMEWKPKIFEPFGFYNLLSPAEVYHEYCEKGETYAYGEFYTDDFTKFTYFVQVIYNTIWGELRDVNKILTEENGVYKFEDKSLIPVVRKEVSSFDDSSDIEYTDDHMTVSITYDTNENKVSFRCQKVKEDKKTSEEKNDTKESSKDSKKEDSSKK